MSKTLIIANWKCNPSTAKDAMALAQKIERGASKRKGVEVALAPPFIYLSEIKGVLNKIKLGAQDSFWSDGPYTGEISAGQLKNLAVEYVIIGHSERRNILGETSVMINQKLLSALKHKIKPVLCVGEQERTDGIPEIVGDQIRSALRGVAASALENINIAYEPIWAISTTKSSRADTPDSAHQALLYIRKVLTDLYDRPSAEKVRIIYGGSVNSDNVSSFISGGLMQGALVGGASLEPEEFLKIIKNTPSA